MIKFPYQNWQTSDLLIAFISGVLLGMIIQMLWEYFWKRKDKNGLRRKSN